MSEMNEGARSTIEENFKLFWDTRDTVECFNGIAVLMQDEGWTGKDQLIFDTSDPDKIPTILLDGECWQVTKLRLHGRHVLELDLVNNDGVKKVCVDDGQIEKFEAYKLLQAVFDNTEHMGYEGRDYEDVEEFYGWELS